MEKKTDKTLYVCRANVGRSQVAMTFHNELAPDTAESAGTEIGEVKAKTLDEWSGAQVVIEAMIARGFDISKNTRRQLTRTDVEKFGRVVVLNELESMPLWLLEVNPERWPVQDLKDLDSIEADKVIDEIQGRVKHSLLDSGGSSCRPLPQAYLDPVQ